mmetsp:Transcript_3934/g.525  ORF Transcript_3934/g.525 Transcript_3934/m.525 type:complete len:84 (+) Transcript_3934:256-507(+)
MKDEVYLLLRHYGEFNETRLRYSEFCKLFAPKREDYAGLVRSRAGTLYPPVDKRRVFNIVTLERLIEVVRLHLECEGVAESIR